uniref:Uncharacterized protein n=1 Tax=Cacopsylla melanoneura TaxID=428564 RepID=A0A8D8ZCA9_9HEMI
MLANPKIGEFYDKVLDMMLANPKIGTLTAKRYIQFYVANHPRLSPYTSNQSVDFIHIFSSCQVRTPASPFLFHKGSPIQLRVNEIVTWMLEAGKDTEAIKHVRSLGFDILMWDRKLWGSFNLMRTNEENFQYE